MPPAAETWAPKSISRSYEGEASLAPTLPPCPSAFAWRRRPQGSCTSAACGPSSSTGSSRVGGAGSACCGSRTPTPAVRSRSPSRRSSARSAGSGSTGTARRRSSSTAWSGRRTRRDGSSTKDGLRGRGRDPHPHARRGRRPAGTTRSRAASSFRTPSSRISCSFAPTVARRTTSPRRSRTGSTGSRTSSEATTTSRTRRSRSTCCARSAPSRPSTRMSRASSARTARSSRSDTARSRSTSSAPRATCAEALMNFLALLGWAPDGETTIMSRDELVERFSLERVGSSPATFDYAKLDWMNGVYLRALPPDEYADRLVAYLREQGLDWPEDARARGRAARAGEDRPARASSRASRASCSMTSSRTRASSTGASSAAPRLRSPGSIRGASRASRPR